jgi:hypothetical protein
MTTIRRGGVSSRIVLVALAAMILIALPSAFEYSQVASIQGQNKSLQSENQKMSTQVSAASLNSSRLSQAWLSHLYKLESINITGALADYAPNPIMNWTGNTHGFGGLYRGTAAINETLWYFLASTTSLYFTIESFNSTLQQNGTASIGAVIALVGHKSSFGMFNGTVSMKYQYAYQNGSWLISREDWNFETLVTPYPVEIF